MIKKIIIIALFILVIITGISSVLFINKDSNLSKERMIDQKQTVYISVDALLKIEYQETFKTCPSKSSSMICSPITTNVTNIDFLNDTAEKNYYNYNYNNKDIYEVIEDIINIAYDNNYDISNVDLIYTSGNFMTSNINVGKLVNYNANFQDSIDKQTVIRHYKNNHIVTFDTDGGSIIHTQSVNKNETIIKPDDPEKMGYEFVEWQLDGKTYNFDKPVTKDITLNAIWSEIISEKVKYTVTFNSNGGSKIPTQIIEEGNLVIEPKEPTKKGYMFVGWTLDNEHFDFNNPITSDITLDADWAAIKKN